MQQEHLLEIQSGNKCFFFARKNQNVLPATQPSREEQEKEIPAREVSITRNHGFRDSYSIPNQMIRATCRMDDLLRISEPQDAQMSQEAIRLVTLLSSSRNAWGDKKLS